MRTRLNQRLSFLGAAGLLAIGLAWVGPGVTAQVWIDDDDIGGVVRGTGGPEAGVWADYGTNAVWHTEGGKGTQGNLVKFQIRPNPLEH